MVVLAERWASPKSKRRKVPVTESEMRARQVRRALARETGPRPSTTPYLSEYLKSRPAETSSLTCLGDERRDILPAGASTRVIGSALAVLGRHRRYGPPLAGHGFGKRAHRSGQ